jgi:hypothetical protein
MPRGPGSEAQSGTFEALRAQLLSSIEACERGLALAYRARVRALPESAADERRSLEEAAVMHLEHAGALHERLGARPGGVIVDALWVFGPVSDPATLAHAERRAYDTLHDCLADLDGETARLVREAILPDHVAALFRACARARLDVNDDGALDVPL